MRKRTTGQKWREWYLLPLLIILLLWVPQVQAEELTELAEEVSFEDLDGVTLPQTQEKQSRIRGRRLLRSTSGSGRWYGSQLSSGDEQKMYQALVAARDDFRKMAQVYKANGNKRVAGSYVQVVLDDPIEYDPSINKNRNGTTYITDPRYEEFRKLFNRALHAYVRDYVEDYWLSSFVVYPATDSITDSSLKQVVSVALVPKVFYNEATKYKNTAGYYDDILTELDQTDESLQDAIAKVAQEDTVYAKVRAAHDYAVELIIYGANDKEYGHTITGGLLKKYNHTAVCECYAKLFLLLCRANGIDCVLVTGGSRRDSNGDIISSHMWNYVQMDDGLWYLLDATWDDSYKNTTYFLAGAQSPNQTGVKTGVNTNTVAKDHMPVGGFSATVQYDPFTVPVWSENSYEENHAQILLNPQKEQVEVNVSETTALPTPSYHFADALENVTFTYTSSDRGIATVDTLGNVTGIKAGAVTITIANSRLPKVYREITVTVKGAVEETAQDEVSGEHIPSGDDSTPSVPKTDGQDESGDENEPQKPGTGGQDESDQESEPQKPGTSGQDESDQESEPQKPGTSGQDESDQEIEPQKPGTDGQDGSDQESESQKPGTGGQDGSDQESESQKPGTGGQSESDQESEPQKPGMDGQSESGDESEPQKPGTGGQSESHQENVLQKPELPGASEQAGGKQSRDSYVRLNASRLQMQLNTGTKLLQIVECDTGDRVREWSSNHPKVVYVDPYTGELRALRTGKAKITLTMVSGARASCVVQVQRGVVKTTALFVPKMTIKLKVGESHLLSVVRTPLTANDKMTFTSSDKKIVSVNKNGKIKAKKKGTAKITIRTAGGRKLVVKVKVKK